MAARQGPSHPSRRRALITKGAFDNVREVCRYVETGEQVEPIADELSSIRRRYVELGDAGYRTLGVAYRQLDEGEPMTKAAERNMVFLGFLVLRDPPKQGIVATVRELGDLGGWLKMITGDNVRVAGSVASQVGLSADRIVTGGDLRKLSDEALLDRERRNCNS